jgi:serine/threonine-protein kinase HipA
MAAKTHQVATVILWDQEVGAVAWDAERGLGQFEFSSDFLLHGFDIAPFTLPLRSGVFSFPELNPKTFYGLPGLLADTLPDRYGNSLIDLWLREQGRSVEDFSPVERLCYMGTRGMGALEFKPALMNAGKAEPIEVDELTKLAHEIVKNRKSLKVKFKGKKAEALNAIVRVGTSAGGNRAKAIIAWNPKTQEVRSGQVKAPNGFEPWILKFDGVNDASLGDPQGFGRIEYAYHKMAIQAGVTMSACQLLEEGGRAHFMTRRFDRAADGQKIHMQSLCAMGHYDFNASGEYGYEQALDVIQRLNLGHEALKEMYRRMVFNIVARNQDDHTRNIAFLMNSEGQWSLSPAFDVIWSYNPAGKWTNRHQMTVHGKRDELTRADLLAVAEQYGIKGAKEILDEVTSAVSKWLQFAGEAGVPSDLRREIAKTHRLKFSPDKMRKRSKMKLQESKL